ncbi:B-cell receptor CD22 isoform X2 [Oreochromis niloticus]|uniref:B-cell receptor CD22 isoform X2 n=1 Tax=Oreochromis niloticus TaxID=8128 RepID=UPI000DF466E8|nr:B-cell receptor CD22 isoform X2 [Oreochromis niloticus]
MCSSDHVTFSNSETNRMTMSVTTAVSGIVVIVLSISVVHSWREWEVTYTSTEICAIKGSTVEMHCTYTYPPRINSISTTVQNIFWFIYLPNVEPVDLRIDSKYAGRVWYHCGTNDCTLRITDLRESDSAVYRLRLITNQPGGNYTGSPGVSLSVTGVEVQTIHKSQCLTHWCSKLEMQCHSNCLPHHSSYIWYKNGHMTSTESLYSGYFYSEDSISCAIKPHETFPSPSVYPVVSKFWFRPDRSHWLRTHFLLWDLSKDSQHADRFQFLEREKGHSTLRISDLRKTDSAEYRFKFTTQSFQWGNISPGTTLTVTDPDVQVQVVWSSTSPQLICQSSCFPSGHSFFVWYKNEEEILGESSSLYTKYADGPDSYSCAYEGHRSNPVYAPKVPSVTRTAPGDIMKGSLVSLTCSSEANPLPKYSWYRKAQTLVSKEKQLFFQSIQPSDSGEYYCTAENVLGKRISEYIFINVKYGPKTSIVLMTPSGMIVEGDSVNLTCSTDANPAAKHTWYKENQPLLASPVSIYHFTAISSEDSGNYSCKSENQYGQITSNSLFIDVKYPPRLPSVSVSPSAEIVEGSSVTLTCSSDANPAANYTWYKENESSPKASGQNFTITDFRTEHSGSYYCNAQNLRGQHRSTLHLIAVASTRKAAVTGTITAVFLAITLVMVFLCIRKCKWFTQQSKDGEKPSSEEQVNMDPVYDTPSAVAEGEPSGHQDDLHYSTIRFSQNQADALYSNIGRGQLYGHKDEEASEAEYTAVKCDNSSRAKGTRYQGNGEDTFTLYSTVKHS